MQPFKYIEAQDTKSSIAKFTANSEYLAGGTTLIDLMKLHVMTPNQLVNLSHLPLKTVRDLEDAVEVGALVSNNEMAYHPLIKTHFPFVSEALLSGASVQLRNLATTAGNILQKTRCSYFRDPESKCNKREPGSGCDALQGINRMNAILGASENCIAAHPSDLCVALMAVGAKIKTQTEKGSREIPFAEFYTLPGNTPHIENNLQVGEMITSVILPKHRAFQRSTYVKIRDRSSYAFALSSAAVAIELEALVVKSVHIAMGGIGTIPWRAPESEKALTGKKLTLENIKLAAKALVAEAKPRTYNAFKVALAEQTLIRALQEVEKKS